MVFAATSDAALNQRIAGDAQRLKVLCNIADAPADSDFVVPSTFRRGDLTIAVSTAGKSPALARRIRLALEDQWGEEYAVLLDILGRIRQMLLQEAHAPDAHKAIFETLLDADLPEMLKKGDTVAVQTLLIEVLGTRCRPEDILPRQTKLGPAGEETAAAATEVMDTNNVGA
jgi:precorrin-2 dehydrogenase/sirohydrochlorin ferrochelatase